MIAANKKSIIERMLAVVRKKSRRIMDAIEGKPKSKTLRKTILKSKRNPAQGFLKRKKIIFSILAQSNMLKYGRK